MNHIRPSSRPLFVFALLGIAVPACDQPVDPDELAFDELDELDDIDDIDDIDAPDESDLPAIDFPGPDGLAGDTPTTEVTGSQQVCSYYVPGGWRDTVVVPDSWNASVCNSLRASLGATSFQLGCLTSTGFSFGSPGGWLPPNNSCGWSW